MEQKREPMNNSTDMRRERQTSGQLTVKSVSIKGAERKSDGCALKAAEITSGDLLLRRGFVTGGAARRPDRRNRSQQRA